MQSDDHFWAGPNDPAVVPGQLPDRPRSRGRGPRHCGRAMGVLL